MCLTHLLRCGMISACPCERDRRDRCICNVSSLALNVSATRCVCNTVCLQPGYSRSSAGEPPGPACDAAASGSSAASQ